jgi:hypothetical protein
VTSPIALPDDVVRYIRDLFVTANDAVAARLDRMPTVHEESLDLALIDVIAAAVGPHVVPSGVVVDVDIHFLGGGVHWDRWEVADIGTIFNFRRGANLLRTKILLLQSKRLYPREAEFVEDRGITWVGGFGSVMVPWPLEVSAPRLLRFDGQCRYKALQVGDDQWRAIAAYEGQHRIPFATCSITPRDCRSSACCRSKFRYLGDVATPELAPASSVQRTSETHRLPSSETKHLPSTFCDEPAPRLGCRSRSSLRVGSSGVGRGTSHRIRPTTKSAPSLQPAIWSNRCGGPL